MESNSGQFTQGETEMATNVAELAKSQISRIENLQKEWEVSKQRVEKIEKELALLCNGHAHSTRKTGAGRPKKVVSKKKEEGRINKSVEIRLYHAAHKDARPKDIIAALAEKGIDVSPAAVWQALNKEPTGKRGRPRTKTTEVKVKEPGKRGRPRKVEVKTEKVEASEEGGQGRRPEGERLEDVVLKVLGRNKSGLKLREVVQRVISQGYKTKSDESTLSAAVQNCLSKLRERAVVTKDQESRRYSVKVA
jgi:hypothetical protein